MLSLAGETVEFMTGLVREEGMADRSTLWDEE